jgi:hypothetical protein
MYYESTIHTHNYMYNIGCVRYIQPACNITKIQSGTGTGGVFLLEKHAHQKEYNVKIILLIIN